MFEQYEREKTELQEKIRALQNVLIDLINDYQDNTRQEPKITQYAINEAKRVLGIELTNRAFIPKVK